MTTVANTEYKILSIGLFNNDTDFYSEVSLKKFKKALRDAVADSLECEQLSNYKINKIVSTILADNELLERVCNMFTIQNNKIVFDEDYCDEYTLILLMFV